MERGRVHWGLSRPSRGRRRQAITEQNSRGSNLGPSNGPCPLCYPKQKLLVLCSLLGELFFEWLEQWIPPLNLADGGLKKRSLLLPGPPPTSKEVGPPPSAPPCCACVAAAHRSPRCECSRIRSCCRRGCCYQPPVSTILVLFYFLKVYIWVVLSKGCAPRVGRLDVLTLVRTCLLQCGKSDYSRASQYTCIVIYHI